MFDLGVDKIYKGLKVDSVIKSAKQIILAAALDTQQCWNREYGKEKAF